MSKEFQSILLEDLQIRWPGFRIRRVALNQHMPRVERLSEHRHGFAQILLYLRGGGLQHLGDVAITVERGRVLLIPPNTGHRFEKTSHVPPICLALDIDTKEPLSWRTSGVLNSRELSEVERDLVALHGLRKTTDELSIQHATHILQILLRLRDSVVGSAPARTGGPVFSIVSKNISRLGLIGLTPGLVAKEAGRSLDHLNRQLRAECGKTVGELVDQSRITRSGELLRSSNSSIGEIASAVGIDDQNYFSRWFRRQTGQTPSRWREAMSGSQY